VTGVYFVVLTISECCMLSTESNAIAFSFAIAEIRRAQWWS
jgi:hypothetical protein